MLLSMCAEMFGIVLVFISVQSVFISRVTAEGPADVAGLRVGDKVLQVRVYLVSSYYRLCKFDTTPVLYVCL